jgi:hypothetical protein
VIIKGRISEVLSSNLKIHWLPYQRQSFYSRLTVDEAAQVLAAQLVRKRWWRMGWAEDAKFQGEVSDQGFNISRIPTYRGWYPIVVGVYNSLETGTRIDVEMKSSWVDIIGWALFCIPVVGFAFTTIASGEFFSFLMRGGCFVLLVGGVLAIAFWLVMMFFFHWEVNKASRFLQEVFQATPNDYNL